MRLLIYITYEPRAPVRQVVRVSACACELRSFLTVQTTMYRELLEEEEGEEGGGGEALPSPRINISAAGAEQEPASTHCVELTFPTPHRSHLPPLERSPGQPQKGP